MKNIELRYYFWRFLSIARQDGVLKAVSRSKSFFHKKTSKKTSKKTTGNFKVIFFGDWPSDLFTILKKQERYHKKSIFFCLPNVVLINPECRTLDEEKDLLIFCNFQLQFIHIHQIHNRKILHQLIVFHN